MKLDHGGAALKVESTHDFETASFNIKASPIAFQVLSSGLYQDKISAVIRELSTNAWDGHRLRENGVKAEDGSWLVQPDPNRTKRPFKVELPSQWNPVFAVRDYGVGLDHAGIMKLYTTYFGSTKSDSNDFTGALGLGSKSPFSMASSFLVISYFNGTKRTYTAMIGEDGFPTIVLMEEVKTGEENGLEVRVTVNPNQVHMFRDRAAKIYAFFDVPPDIPGLTINKPTYVRKSDKWGIREHRNSAPTGVIMGQICYPITLSALDGKVKPQIYSILQSHNGSIDFFCDIGDVDFQASREALSYTQRTFDFFENALDNFYQEARRRALDEFNKCTTYLDGYLYLRNCDSLTKQLLEDDRAKGLLKIGDRVVDWTTTPREDGTIAASELCLVSEVVTQPAPTAPAGTQPTVKHNLLPKFRSISAYNGETLDTHWNRGYNASTKMVEYSFSLPTSIGRQIMVVLNDQGAPLYQIRDHLINEGIFKHINKSAGHVHHLFLVDKKYPETAKALAKIFEVSVTNISSWNMAAASLVTAQKLARIFTARENMRNTYDVTDRIESESDLKSIRYYICSRGNAHTYDNAIEPTLVSDTASVNSFMLMLRRYGYLSKDEAVAIVPKSKEDEFKKMLPNVKHISTIRGTKKWGDFDQETQREISAMVFRSKINDNRFEQQADAVTADIVHFLTQVIEGSRVDGKIRQWAAQTINTYTALANEVYSKLSRGTRPHEPKAYVEWFEQQFKSDIVCFQGELDKLTKLETAVHEMFPTLGIIQNLYYNRTNSRYYAWPDEVKRNVQNAVARDTPLIYAALGILDTENT